MENNLVIIHGGGPTAVMNASLYGAVKEARKHQNINHIYAAIGGTEGILKENFFDLKQVSDTELEKLLTTPGTSIGTSRFEINENDYEQMIEIFKKNQINYVLLNGGNGTMDTCEKIYQLCLDNEINVVGIPKTIDNDLAETDHAPGYASAANFIAKTTAEIGMDVRSLPIHVSIIEAMGRNAGWITAASSLARKQEGDAPHLIYLPEVPFEEEKFLDDVLQMHKKYGGVVICASEGLKNKDGQPIVPPIFKSGRSVYYGDVGAYLAELVIKKLGIKARSEKPGISGRASITMQSAIDVKEAQIVGEKAVAACIAGETGVMIAMKRHSTKPYEITYESVALSSVRLHEKKMPKNFIHENGRDVTSDFIDWALPLVDENISNFIDFSRENKQGDQHE